MLFVNLGQMPLITSLIIILLILIGATLYRQQKIRNLLFSKAQQLQLLSGRIKGVKTTKVICMITITVLLGLALLDPRGSSLSSELELEGTDLVFVYDISRSMDVQDIQGSTDSRLDFGKKLGAQLMDSLVGNRIGLVAYAADAIRLLPLTTDLDSVGLFIEELSSDMLSSQSTDIGKALDEAVKNFREDTLTHKSIVLFSDGENLDGSINEALDIIKQKGISIFVIGLGSKDGGQIPVIDPRNNSTNYLRTTLGKTIISKLDEKYLQELADRSGGTYFLGSRASMLELARLIDNITKNPFGANTQSFLEPKFRSFLLFALLALIIYLFLPETKTRRKKITIGLLFLVFLASPNYGLTDERSAYSSYKNEEYSTALRFFQRSLIKDPSNLKSKYGEGASLYKLERGDRAEKSFLALTNSEDPELAQNSIFNAGNSRVVKKDLDGALELYKQVMRNNPTDSRLYQKALNNYIYTRALQQQQQQQQQQQPQDQQQQGDQEQQEQDSQNQENNDQNGQDQQQDQNGEKKENQQNNQDQQNGQQGNTNQQQGEQQEDQSPSQSVSPSDIDNLLGVAEENEKANLSKQFKKEKGLFQQNKY